MLQYIFDENTRYQALAFRQAAAFPISRRRFAAGSRPFSSTAFRPRYRYGTAGAIFVSSVRAPWVTWKSSAARRPCTAWARPRIPHGRVAWNFTDARRQQRQLHPATERTETFGSSLVGAERILRIVPFSVRREGQADSARSAGAGRHRGYGRLQGLRQVRVRSVAFAKPVSFRQRLRDRAGYAVLEWRRRIRIETGSSS